MPLFDRYSISVRKKIVLIITVTIAAVLIFTLFVSYMGKLNKDNNKKSQFDNFYNTISEKVQSFFPNN